MTAPLRRDRIAIDPIAVFTARAEARATLWADGVLDLHAAVDELQHAAEAGGLVELIGQDAVQQILAAAFAAAHEQILFVDIPGDDPPDNMPDLLLDLEPCADVAASTLRAAEYLVLENDADRLRKWIAQHSAKERRAIHQHLRRRSNAALARKNR
jgi:hypothetical protein